MTGHPIADFKLLDIPDSSLVKRVWYNPSASVLRVEFKDRRYPDSHGDVGDYSDVTAEFVDSLEKQGDNTEMSAGKLIYHELKSQPDEYPYEVVLRAGKLPNPTAEEVMAAIANVTEETTQE
jgi:hypothetical protein